METLSNEQCNPIALSGFQPLLGTGESWKLDDETQEETIYLGEYGTVDGLTLDSERSILLLDGGVFIFDYQVLESSPIGDVLPLPTEQVFGNGDSMCGFGVQGTCFIMHPNNYLKSLYQTTMFINLSTTIRYSCTNPS